MPRLIARGDARTTLAHECAALYKSGHSTEQIGKRFGIGHGTVWNLLHEIGVTIADNPRTVRGKTRLLADARTQAEKNAARMAKLIPGTGMTYREGYDANGGASPWRKGTPVNAFAMHARNALKRGIEWRFTFAEWWRVWQESGRWEQRGRRGGYCMARWGDVGPYAADNVYICTRGENSSDAFLTWSDEKRTSGAKRRLARAQEMVALRAQGRTYSQVAKHFNISLGTVNWTLGKHKHLLISAATDSQQAPAT